MPELSEITARFSGGEWMKTLAAVVRQADEQRLRAGRQLHDQAGPLLSSAGLQLGVLSLDSPGTQDELRSHLSGIQQLLDQAIDQVRSVSRALSPGPSERLGVRFALERAVETFERESGRQITLHCGDCKGLPPDSAHALVEMFSICVAFTLKCGEFSLQTRVAQRALGWILEVLYYGAGPHARLECETDHRSRLILLQYEAMRCGATVRMDGPPQGEQSMRVLYSGSQLASTASWQFPGEGLG